MSHESEGLGNWKLSGMNSLYCMQVRDSIDHILRLGGIA